jgi:hypothetical protein
MNIHIYFSEGPRLSVMSVDYELYCTKSEEFISAICMYHGSMSWFQLAVKSSKYDSKQLNAFPIQTVHNYLTLFLFTKMEVIS